MEEIIIGLAGALIGFIGSMLLLRFNYKNLFAKTISSERVSWLKDMRELVDNLMSELAKEDKSNVNQYTSKIILRLNPNNDEDLINYLKEIEADPNEANIDDIRHKFSVMFKEEWEKVKYEAKGISKFIKYSKDNRCIMLLHGIGVAITYVSIFVIIGLLIFNCNILDNISNIPNFNNAYSIIKAIKSIYIISVVFVGIKFILQIICWCCDWKNSSKKKADEKDISERKSK